MFSLNFRKCCQLVFLENRNLAKTGVNHQILNKYSKNVKVRRGQAPNESKNTGGKWTSRRAQMVEEVKLDKNFVKREIVDPVWLMNEYKPQAYEIEEAIQFHKEMAQESMLNNPDGFLHVRLLLDMTTKKKAKFMENIKGAVYYPNSFKEGIQKEVIAICKQEEEIEAALKAGALMAGHTDVLKKFEKGEISDQIYDFLVCTPETFADILLVKKKIHKDKLPSLKTNTVSENIAETVTRFYLSKDYESSKISDEKGVLKTKIGTLNMGIEQLTENLSFLVEKIKSHKRHATDGFITDCVIIAPPSTEKFKVDLTRFSAKEIEENDELVKQKN